MKDKRPANLDDFNVNYITFTVVTIALLPDTIGRSCLSSVTSLSYQGLKTLLPVMQIKQTLFLLTIMTSFPTQPWDNHPPLHYLLHNIPWRTFSNPISPLSDQPFINLIRDRERFTKRSGGWRGLIHWKNISILRFMLGDLKRF